MDPMVSARVPVEIRDQANARLKEMGSSPTELINLAYSEFLRSGELPRGCRQPKPGRRTLTAKMLADLKSSIDQTTFDIPRDIFAEEDFDKVLERRLREEYEALA